MRRRITAFVTALSALITAFPRMSLTVFADEASVNPKTNLPYAFDLREKGLVTAVKNQNPYGTCWAHGMMASLESEMIADDPTVDLSEWFLAYALRSGEIGLTDDPNFDVLGSGSFFQDAVPLLLNKVGPMREADYPYDSGVPDLSGSIEEYQQKAALEVTAAHLYDPWDNDSHTYQFDPLIVKKLLYSGKAVAFSVSTSYLGSSCYDSEKSTLYYPEQLADQIRSEFAANDPMNGHLMTLVGWDDNYPAENFHYKPDRNGAWLVKNSWSAGWGDCGYVWISYADETLTDFGWFDVRPASDHDQYFSYDNWGVLGTLSFSLKETDTEGYYANVFVPEQDTCLTDLTLACLDPADKMEVTVYTGLKDRNNPASGTASKVMTYTFPEAGYFQVALSEAVVAKRGEPFAVAVRASGNAGAHIPCEIGQTDWNIVKDRTGYMRGNYRSFWGLASSAGGTQIARSFGRQESFVSKDGKTWTDTADLDKIVNTINLEMFAGNVCVRAYGVDAGSVRFSKDGSEAAVGEQIALTNAEGADIYFAVDGGEYQLYKEPITFEGDMTISAYADTGSKTVYTKEYKQRHAVLSSLLMLDKSGFLYANLQKRTLKLTVKEGAFLQPISTGSITINGEKVTSGHKYFVKPEDVANGIVVRVEQEGMIPTEYKISVKEDAPPEIPNGLYYDIYSNTVCEFRNGTALEKNLTDGTETAFTYEQVEAGIWEFRTADGVNRYRSDIWTNSDDGFLRGFISLETETETYRMYDYLNPLSFAAYPAYMLTEIQSLALPAYQNSTGRKATSVKIEETFTGDVTLAFYNGKTLLDTLYADRFGLMYSEDMSQRYYYAPPQYRKCDLNGDKELSVADAVLMQRIVCEDTPEKAPAQSALDAADLDNDGVLTVLDTQFLIDMLQRMSDYRA